MPQPMIKKKKKVKKNSANAELFLGNILVLWKKNLK